MYQYTVEFVLEYMVMIVSVSLNEPDLSDEFITEQAREILMNYYKIDPSVLYLQDVIVHNWEN
jgi:hypothetical protein